MFYGRKKVHVSNYMLHLRWAWPLLFSTIAMVEPLEKLTVLLQQMPRSIILHPMAFRHVDNTKLLTFCGIICVINLPKE